MEDPGLVNFGTGNIPTSMIKVVGVGGGGGNAVNHMLEDGIKGVDFIICNTDKQDLDKSNVSNKVLIGYEACKGLGCGANPKKGREAAEESRIEIENAICTENAQMAFITAGMGGGTGTGAAPVVARIVHDKGLLTIGIVTIPYLFEGHKKIEKALAGIDELRSCTDAILVINNERIKDIYPDMNFFNSWKMSDMILSDAAKGIAEVITKTGLVNIDFADVAATMRNSGIALIGTGLGTGEHRMYDAFKNAVTSPLLQENDIRGAQRILFVIYSRTDENSFMGKEIEAISKFMEENEGKDADLIWGVYPDDSLEEGQIKVMVIATGFKSESLKINSKQVEDKTENPNQDLFSNTESSITEETTVHEEKKANIDEYYGKTETFVKEQEEKNQELIDNVNDEDTLKVIEEETAVSRRKNIAPKPYTPRSL
ncbi:MAG: cell division protein FtsZ [Paludibacteraceae bacterium]|nr:cell division protein FtsZ [Paludibacteraceae bacterium]